MMWLLIEDETDIRTVVELMMQLWGETPQTFADGNAAWRWMDGIEAGTITDIPELVLTDIRMPGHTGDQIATRMRQIDALKNVPVILMTAFSLSDSEVAEMKLRTGFDHLIRKPLPDMEEFRSTLYRIRDEKRKQQQPVQQPQPEPPHA